MFALHTNRKTGIGCEISVLVLHSKITLVICLDRRNGNAKTVKIIYSVTKKFLQQLKFETMLRVSEVWIQTMPDNHCGTMDPQCISMDKQLHLWMHSQDGKIL